MISAKNMCVFLGRTTQDIKLEKVGKAGDVSKASICLAIDAGKDKTDFLYMSAFGKTAEFAAKYVKKGQRILVTSHMTGGSYTDKDGKTSHSQSIIVDEISFADGGQQGVQSSDKAAPAGRTSSAPDFDENGFMRIPETDEDGFPFN